MNNFVLTYNPVADKPSPGQLLNHVQTSRFITQYYQPYLGMFLLKSESPAADVVHSVHGLFDGEGYMLAQIDPKLVGGNLTQDAWNWLNYGIIPEAKPAPAPRPVPTFNALAPLWDNLPKTK